VNEKSIQPVAFSIFLPFKDEAFSVCGVVGPPMKIAVLNAAVYPIIESISHFPLSFLRQPLESRLSVYARVRSAPEKCYSPPFRNAQTGNALDRVRISTHHSSIMGDTHTVLGYPPIV
jgi:hypothetical protein